MSGDDDYYCHQKSSKVSPLEMIWTKYRLLGDYTPGQSRMRLKMTGRNLLMSASGPIRDASEIEEAVREVTWTI